MSKKITISVEELENILKDAERAADWSRLTATHHTDARTTAHKQAKNAEWYAESVRIRVKEIAKREVAR